MRINSDEGVILGSGCLWGLGATSRSRNVPTSRSRKEPAEPEGEVAPHGKTTVISEEKYHSMFIILCCDAFIWRPVCRVENCRQQHYEAVPRAKCFTASSVKGSRGRGGTLYFPRKLCYKAITKSCLYTTGPNNKYLP